MATDHLSGASFNMLRMLPFCGVLVNDLAAAAQILIRVRENFTQWLSRYARGPCVKRRIGSRDFLRDLIPTFVVDQHHNHHFMYATGLEKPRDCLTDPNRSELQWSSFTVHDSRMKLSMTTHCRS